MSVDRFEERRDVADAAAVWAVLTDPSRIPRWLTIAHDVTVEGAAGPGQQLHVAGGHLGVRRTLTVVVAELDEPAGRLVWTIDQPVTVRFDYRVTAEPSRLDAVVEADLSGLPRMATRLAVRSLRREFGRSVDRLVRLAHP